MLNISLFRKKKINIKMTFAIIGFAAEESIYPFEIQIKSEKYFQKDMRLHHIPGSMNGFLT